jgi:hypothetical protein
MVTTTTFGTFSFSAAPCGSSTCADKQVSFSILFFDPTLPYITNFRPTSQHLYGRTPVTIDVFNLPAELDASQLAVEFGAVNVSVTLVQHSSIKTSTIQCMLPSVIAPCSVRPILHIIPERLFVVLPANFTFTRPPIPAIQSVVPNIADLTVEHTIQITVQNFPGVSGPTEEAVFGSISVEFQLASGVVAQGTVIGYMREQDTHTHPLAVQTVRLLVKTPRSGLMAGIVDPLRIWNKEFEANLAQWSTFAFVDARAPHVVSMQGNNVRGPDNLRVPMSEPTVVTISVQNVPTFVSEYAAQVDGRPVKINFGALNSDDKTADIVLTMGVSAEVKTVFGLIAFGKTPSDCTSSCCAASTCTSICPGVKVACFSLSTYDDLMPSLVHISTSTGPEIGGTENQLVSEKFPRLAAESFVWEQHEPWRGSPDIIHACSNQVDHHHTSDRNGCR